MQCETKERKSNLACLCFVTFVNHFAQFPRGNDPNLHKMCEFSFIVGQMCQSRGVGQSLVKWKTDTKEETGEL